MNAVPMLKRKFLEERVTLPLDKATANDLRQLKSLHGVDTMEWLRAIIRTELPKLKKQLSA